MRNYWVLRDQGLSTVPAHSRFETISLQMERVDTGQETGHTYTHEAKEVGTWRAMRSTLGGPTTQSECLTNVLGQMDYEAQC